MMYVNGLFGHLGCLILVTLIANTCAQSGGCQDRDPSCKNAIANGDCQNDPRFMSAVCPVTCNLCPDSFPNLKSLVNPDFQCGKPYTGKSSTRTNKPIGSPQILFPHEIEALRLRLKTSANTRLSEETSSATATAGVDSSNAFCGGTPIHERFILTAAHCVVSESNPVSSIRLGELDFSRDDENNSKPVDYRIKQIIVHPGYGHGTAVRYFDLALLLTEERIEFNDIVYPFCMSNTRPLPAAEVTGSGFGVVNITDRANILQEAQLNIVSSDDCEGRYRQQQLEDVVRITYPEFINNTDILCAAYPGRDACQGDSGGPLFQDLNGIRYLVGIATQGLSCRGNGEDTLPGFFISVADHIDFINSVVYDSGLISNP